VRDLEAPGAPAELEGSRRSSFRSIEGVRLPRVCVVIVNWNGWEDTLDCLTSLGELDYGGYDVIVVDNGSTNDSVRRISDEFRDIEVVALERNLGFSGGCNVGIRHAFASGSQYVWLLNNDTKVDPNALRTMVELAESDERIGAVGSVLYDMSDPEKIQTWGGGKVSLWFGRTRHRTEEAIEDSLCYLTGASLLLRSSSLAEVGLLDEGYFMYWEDVDLCFRLRNANWKLMVARDSKVWHREGASSGRNKTAFDRHLWMSTARFCKQHAPLAKIATTAATFRMVGKRLIQLEWMRAGKLCKAIGAHFRDRVRKRNENGSVEVTDRHPAAGAEK
jgi:GT2 family glycosyltransferase